VYPISLHTLLQSWRMNLAGKAGIVPLAFKAQKRTPNTPRMSASFSGKTTNALWWREAPVDFLPSDL